RAGRWCLGRWCSGRWTAGGQHELLSGLDGRAVGEPVRLDECRERDAVTLGKAIEGITLLHLDGFAARCSPRPVHWPTGIALGSGRGIGRGCGRIVARVGKPRARAGVGWWKGCVWEWARVGRRTSAAPGFAKARAARCARWILVAAPAHGFRRRGQRARLATLVSETKDREIKPCHVGTASADQDRQSDR